MAECDWLIRMCLEVDEQNVIGRDMVVDPGNNFTLAHLQKNFVLTRL